MHAESQPVILMYHSISRGRPPLRISSAVFASQMDWLKRNAHVAALAEAVDFVVGGKLLPPRTVVLTFDDGFADFYSEAAPILRRAGFAATVFLPTGFCGRTNAWHTQLVGIGEQPLLTWSQVRELVAQGFEFGSHSINHPVLTQLSDAEAEREIAQSKAEIEGQTGAQVRFFCYPYGRWNDRVRHLVAKHYSGSCSAILGSLAQGADPFVLPRLDAYYVRRLGMFRRLFSSYMRPYLGLRRRLRRIRYGTGF